MYYDIIDPDQEIKSNDFKKWCISQFESIFGEFPEVEIKNEEKQDVILTKEKPLLKKHKSLRYFVFPVVLILIIIDEIYIRIKDYIKKIDISD